MRIVFACAGMTYDGDTPENEPLGGSESALVYLAKELVRFGANVTIYNRCANPGWYDGVLYQRWEQLFIEEHQPADFFIAIRSPQILSVWRGSGVRMLWCQDWYDQPVLCGVNEEYVDEIVFVGEWQRDGFINKLGWPLERSWTLPNGICPEYYNTEDHLFRPKDIFYSSTPFRGVKHLVSIYPKIRERVKECNLHIFGGMGVYQDWNSEYDRIYKSFESMDGVHIHGPLGQRELAKRMEQCRILAYPNTFPETCCTTAIEAMAAGNLVITSHRAGLVETVGPRGVLIEGEPGTPEYDEAFIDECVFYLENETQWGYRARLAWEWAINGRSWQHLADHWINTLDLINMNRGLDVYKETA